ncbi:hypothetical protein RHSIM_Rhsim13G0224700 [Rhododendron simsii]|uniref:Uncharacterized protein n=1 Tax=Rhododendron simsii TaxID=118357 RepID=A0A834G0R4_RHOSS|nr:hypothetical protein RHSIM_Rhsim13G0224700 [Rhododendron simsii]
MDKYLVPLNPTHQTKPIKRPRWKRILSELNGKFEPKYRHDVLGLLLQSYYEGIYLASVTKAGCLTVHDFEIFLPRHLMTVKMLGFGAASAMDSPCHFIWPALSLYVTSFSFLGLVSTQVNFECPSGLKEDETKHLLHISTPQQLDVVRWNLANQDEVLRKRPTGTKSDVHRGLSDIAFSSNSNSRVLASDTYGMVNAWDRRMSDLPCLELTTHSSSKLNSIQLVEENQVVFGACENGIIHIWDLRGGNPATAFRSHKEAHAPVSSVKLASVLEKVGSLKAQSHIVSKGIYSIDIDPSCPYQLAFHLDDGWSGVLDIHNFQATHVHCPPPPWLDGENVFTNLSCLRKPSWLRTDSIYAVGSAYNDGIHLLDFYPDPSSPCHIDYNEDLQRGPRENSHHKQNRFVPLSEGVTACATHPLNSTIVAGTKVAIIFVGDFPKIPVIGCRHDRVKNEKNYWKPDSKPINQNRLIGISDRSQ